MWMDLMGQYHIWCIICDFHWRFEKHEKKHSKVLTKDGLTCIIHFARLRY